MVNVRTAKTEDIDKISIVLAASWKTAYRGIVADDYLDSIREDRWVDFLTAGLSNGAIFSMVLQENQEIAGASILGKSEKENEVRLISFYLAPDRIGQGYGHIFYSGIEKKIKSRGFTKCVIDVLEKNDRAIKFYKSHGFDDTRTEVKITLGNRDYICKVFEKTYFFPI